MSRALGIVLLAVFGVFGAACGSGIAAGRYDITLQLGSSVAGAEGASIPSLEADLVGVSDFDMERWSNHSMTEYFGGQDTLRAEAPKYTMQFSSESPDPKTLDAKDSVWETWKQRSATHVFVLINLPGVRDDRAGDQDARRLILPLAKNRWSGRDILIEVQRSGLVPLTRVRPAEN